jgi:rhodanese-related sulfurtransferase
MTMDVTKSGFVTAEGIHNLSPREAAEWCAEGALILDIREEYISQFKKLGVPVAIQIPLSRLAREADQVPKDKWIIVADSSGLHSKEACLQLKEKGFTQISNLAGGLVEWERDGLPLVVDKSEKLSGSCACQLRAREQQDPERS